jgi:hypothetical protein
VRYFGGTIIGEGGIVYRSGAGTVRAERVEIDTTSGQITAFGTVSVERLAQTTRREIAPRALASRTVRETVLETLRGENFVYNARTGKGRLDTAELRLSGFLLTTDSVVINGRQYAARNVVIRPGALTPAEEKIYGRPPFTLRARQVTVDFETRNTSAASVANSATPGSVTSSNRRPAGRDEPRIAASGAGLYYKNTRLLPIPSYVLQRATSGGGRDDSAYRLTPRLAFNSADRVVLTTTLRYPLGQNPLGAAFIADLGLSARIGVRGGAALEYPTGLGTFLLRGRKNDIVTTQLTNRIVLDRTPEVAYISPAVRLFRLPGGNSARFGVNLSQGNFSERTIDAVGSSGIKANRSAVDMIVTTRSDEHNGPYVELFALTSRYSNFNTSYRRKRV